MNENVSNNRNSNYKQYRKSEVKSLFEILTIVLISIFSGFILGLLFAPQSGLKTRKKVTEKLKDIIDRGKFTLAEVKVMSEELLDKSKKKVGKVSSIIKGENQEDIS